MNKILILLLAITSISAFAKKKKPKLLDSLPVEYQVEMTAKTYSDNTELDPPTNVLNSKIKLSANSMEIIGMDLTYYKDQNGDETPYNPNPKCTYDAKINFDGVYIADDAIFFNDYHEKILGPKLMLGTNKFVLTNKSPVNELECFSNDNVSKIQKFINAIILDSVDDNYDGNDEVLYRFMKEDKKFIDLEWDYSGRNGTKKNIYLVDCPSCYLDIGSAFAFETN